MNSPSYYGNLPAEVRYSKELKPMEKILYTELTALSNKYGYCIAKNSYFASLYEVHKDTAGKWINSLEKQGFIRTQLIYKEGTKQILQRRIYISRTPIDENIDTYRQEDREGIDEKCDTPIDENIEDINITREEYYKSNSTPYSPPKENPLLKDFSLEDKKIAQDFIEYRKEIKKPIKTKRAIKSHITRLKECVGLGLGSLEELTCHMKEREWLTISREYLEDKHKSPPSYNNPNKARPDEMTNYLLNKAKELESKDYIEGEIS